MQGLHHYVRSGTTRVESSMVGYTEDIGYYDYLGTWGKNSHRQIIVTGRYGRLR